MSPALEGGFLTTGPPGKSLLAGFGSGSVMYFIQMMAGVGIAGGWPGIYLSSGHLRASPCDFTARASLWQPQGSYTANMTGSGYQQELSGNKAKAASPFLTQPRKSLLHFVGYRQVT